MASIGDSFRSNSFSASASICSRVRLSFGATGGASLAVVSVEKEGSVVVGGHACMVAMAGVSATTTTGSPVKQQEKPARGKGGKCNLPREGDRKFSSRDYRD